MAIDQRDVSSTLRFMDDRALQQYAAMYKNDPYIFPLAFQESQNRQRLRMSQQGAQGMQPQPKVNDQALAQMAPQQLPEQMGIGALPADNMQQMADGGIAGYDDADFVSRSEPVVMMAGGGHIPRYQGNPQDGSLVRGRTSWEDELERLQAPPQESSALGRGIVNAFTYSSDFEALVQSAKAKQARGIPLTAPEARALQSEQAPAATKKESPFEQERARNMARVANEGYTRGDPRALPTMPSAKEQLSAGAAPKVDTERKDTGRRDERKATAASEDSASAGLAGLKDPAKLYQDILAKQDYKDPAADAMLELEARERADAAAERQAVVTDAERFKDVYKNREGRLAEREADIGKQRTQNTGLALLNAGLAIMSTPGGLATAIGKGAQVGTAQFASGLDKIRSAQERLGEARDRLDDLKLNREETTAKELRAAERNYRDVATNAQKRTIDGIRTAAGVNRADAKNIYDKTIDVQKTMYEQGEANKRSAAGNRNNQLEMLQALQADPKLMETYRTMQGKNEDVMGQYNDFLKANPALAMDPKAAFTQFLMTKSAFAQLGASPVTDKAAGPVRKQP